MDVQRREEALGHQPGPEGEVQLPHRSHNHHRHPRSLTCLWFGARSFGLVMDLRLPEELGLQVLWVDNMAVVPGESWHLVAARLCSEPVL